MKSLGLTEEQIIHTFSTVGQVLNFRLVYDSDTGRPKGFGFCEFADAEAAASAVRNLNGYEVLGRELRVDFSHQGAKDSDTNSNQVPNQQQQSTQPAQAPPNGYQPPPPGALPPLPSGVDLAAGLTCPDAISKTLSTLQPSQLLDILSQMKGLVMGDPARATELLKQAPQLAYAIFQALLLMGLVDTSVLSSVVESSNQAPSAQALPQPPPQSQQPPQPPQQIPPRPSQGYQAPAAQQYPPYPPMPGQIHAPTPPTYNPPYQPPPIPAPPQQQAQQSEQELVRQVLAMTPQQVDQLPPNDRVQVMNLRASLGVR